MTLLKSDFIKYYLDENSSNSEPGILEKYVQAKPRHLTYEQEVEQYSTYRPNEGFFIDRIKPEFKAIAIWEELLNETLTCFQETYNIRNKRNFIATFVWLTTR